MHGLPAADRAIACVRTVSCSLLSLTVADSASQTGRGLSVFRTVYKLDPRKLARGSGFDKYRKGIKDQLKKHPEFFFLHFLSCLEVQTVENPEDLGFVHVLIRINAPGVENKKEGLTVKQVEFVLFDAKDRGDGARLGRPLREWKNKVKVGHIGISFAFNFKVYYPKNAVFFGVLLGMQMEKGKFSYARREKLVLEPALYRWWDAEIQEVLGDHVGNSRRRAPETSRRKSRKRSRSPRSLAPPKPAYYENHEGFIDESCRIPVPQCVIC